MIRIALHVMKKKSISGRRVFLFFFSVVSLNDDEERDARYSESQMSYNTNKRTNERTNDRSTD